MGLFASQGYWTMEGWVFLVYLDFDFLLELVELWQSRQRQVHHHHVVAVQWKRMVYGQMLHRVIQAERDI